MGLADVRAELASRLAGVSVNGTPFRVIPAIADKVNVPCAMIGEGDPFIDYGVALDNGTVVYNFVVTVLVSRVSERSAQLYLDAARDMTGVASVRAALEVTGAVLDFVNVNSSSHVMQFTVGAVDYLGCTFAVEASES